nr:N-6 DNA methylase [Nevskia sp.]
MDASLYKDYVLFMLFIKYVSDKYADSDDFAPPIVIPKGASFRDMVALKGKSDIGERINTDIIKALIEENPGRLAHSDFPDFNDPNLLGEGAAMVDRLGNLIAIFQKPELDFSNNRAEHDDILGDAYEYLMRHFATESGKSKGQFYTPSEVSRVMAKVIGISSANTVAATTAYDPTCGSGSLLLKVAAEAGKQITLEGQEKDVTTAGLARMNMILHDFPTANIRSGNTLAEPKFKDGERLRTYDYVVANPPFSDKAWSTGLVLGESGKGDVHQRFEWGVPPAKQGDYAYLLHIIRSLKHSGKGACILPHGVLFRGNAEAVIRKKLVESGILKGIIGLPANLFYGTGIPACILVLDKENATARKAIFLIDASKGFIKDSNKNRLRERDLHRIVDVFTNTEAHPGYSRLVPVDEIERNDFNLNLPRYIDTQDAEDIQDLAAHLHGGIPERDVDALSPYWRHCPDLRAALFSAAPLLNSPLPPGEGQRVRERTPTYKVTTTTKPRPGYLHLKVAAVELKSTIHNHPQFAAFINGLQAHFAIWHQTAATSLRQLAQGRHPRTVIRDQAEALLHHAEGQPLIDPYAIYQHLMDYWASIMQDDVYAISTDGWAAKPVRILETDNRGRVRDRGWACDLVPKALIVARYYAAEQAAIDSQQAELESLASQISELEEEQGGDEGVFADFDKINAAIVKERLREIGRDKAYADERAVLQQWQLLCAEEADLRKTIRAAEATLDQQAHDRYAGLTVDEIKTLVVDDKWLAVLGAAIQSELDRVSQTLTSRIRLLADRYAAPLPQLVDEVAALAARVEAHLRKMEAAANASVMA